MQNSLKENIIGLRSNMLTVIEYGGKRHNVHMWKCLCDCGGVCTIKTPKLTGSYKQISCGCMSSRLHNGKSQRVADTALKNHYYRYQTRAQKFNREFSLTMEEFRSMVMSDCYYCDAEPVENSHSKRTAHANYKANTIDRIDSSKGYLIENCRSCCWPCNQAKNVMSEKEFYSWIERVHNKSIKTGRIERKQNATTDT